MIERGSCLPSSRPRRVDSEPAATLRTTTSSGMISTSRISCSRMLSRFMKCVGTPISPSRMEDVLGDAVVEHALAFDQRVLLGVEGGRIVLEMLDERAGLGPFVQDLGLAFVDPTPLVHCCWSLSSFCAAKGSHARDGREKRLALFSGSQSIGRWPHPTDLFTAAD